MWKCVRTRGADRRHVAACAAGGRVLEAGPARRACCRPGRERVCGGRLFELSIPFESPSNAVCSFEGFADPGRIVRRVEESGPGDSGALAWVGVRDDRHAGLKPSLRRNFRRVGRRSNYEH